MYSNRDGASDEYSRASIFLAHANLFFYFHEPAIGWVVKLGGDQSLWLTVGITEKPQTPVLCILFVWKQKILDRPYGCILYKGT